VPYWSPEVKPSQNKWVYSFGDFSANSQGFQMISFAKNNKNELYQNMKKNLKKLKSIHKFFRKIQIQYIFQKV